MAPKSNRPVDWEALVTDHEQALYRAALAILGDPQEAEDAVQDAFLKFLEKAPEDLEHPGAWLMRVLVNGCKSRLRARRRHPWVELLDVYPAPDGDSREVLEAVMALPEKLRTVIHLHYYEGYAVREIAQLLGVTVSTVKMRMKRGRDALRERLEDAG